MRDPTQIRFRCSSIGHLMTEPKLKSEVLSVGAKTYVRELAAQAIFGVDFEVSSREMAKGTECEGDSIALFNSVFGRSLVKNTERKTDEYLSGESDLPDDDEVIDIKTAWSVATFPLCEDDVSSAQRSLYDWQLRAYCRLWDKPRGRIAYCLVNTPEHLIGREPQSLHFVDHIPERMRVTTWAVERDLEKEAAMVEKVKHARRYYAQVIAEFDEAHGGKPSAVASLLAQSIAQAAETSLPASIFS